MKRGGAIELWRTFPSPPTGETGTPHVFLVTRWSCRPRNSHVFLFREMALSAPEKASTAIL